MPFQIKNYDMSKNGFGGKGAGAQFALSKFRDSAEGEGFQAKIAGYDDPERRFIQARSPDRPRMSPLATKIVTARVTAKCRLFE
jgi:hypothetical protein